VESRARNIRSLSGYWFGPPCWFGPPTPTPIDLPGLPPETLSFYRRVLAVGGDAIVTANGVVLIDFTGLDGGGPTRKEIAASPFGGDPTSGKAGALAQRRVELLNAHQLCLISAIGTLDSGEDEWSPSARPVNVKTMISGSDEDRVYGAPDEMLELSEFTQSTSHSNFQRTLFNVSVETVDRSFELFERLIAAGDISVRAAHLVLNAADHYHHWRFEQALITAWASAEALLSGVWERYVTTRANEVKEFNLNATRRDRLMGSDFTTAVVAEVLALAGVISQDLFDELAVARSARNKWIHGLARVPHDAVSAAVAAATSLLEVGADARLDVPLVLPSAGL
jgi:predicted small integral membrane protein